MKKQQILALIMAGTLAAGMAPATMAFAESDAQTVTTDDTAAAVESDEAAEPVQDTAVPAEEGDAAAETPAEAPAEDNTADNAATQEPSQDQTDTPAADQSTDSSQADGFGSGDAETQEAGEAGIATQAEENSDASEETSTGKIYFQDAEGNQTECKTLADAILMAPANADKNAAPSQILVTGTIEISDTIVISDSRNVSIAAAEDGTVIKRADGFLDDMFMVQGENTAFQFGTGKNGDTVLSLTVDASSADDATGSIVSLEKGYFGMSDGVTLTGNRTSAPGSAIYNQGGSIGLGGGTITDNQSMDKGGAIYSEGEIRVSGNVIVSENYDDGVNYENSIVLSGENAYIAATGVLSDTANLQVRRSDADVVKAFVTIGKDADGNACTTMDNVLEHVHYLDTDKYTVNATTGQLEEVKTPTVERMKLKAKSLAWNTAYDHTVDLSFTTNDAGVGGKYYATWVKISDDIPSFEDIKKNNIAAGDIATQVEVQLTGVAYDTDIKVVVYGVDSKGVEAEKPLVLTLEAKATPEEPDEPDEPTRPALTPPVTDSKVTGLEEPLAFYPKTMYNFKVVGAGTENTDPVNGDTKWVPYGWSVNKDNIRSGYEKSFSIGNKYGIKEAKTFKMYIFFQKYIYVDNKKGWQSVTGVQEALEQKFYSKAIEFTVTPSGTITPTGTDGSGSGDGYDGGSGDGSDSTDPENYSGDDSSTGSSSASNARTADNSPIATMMMLASLSLVAGGYVLVRKRKREN